MSCNYFWPINAFTNPRVYTLLGTYEIKNKGGFIYNFKLISEDFILRDIFLLKFDPFH